MLSLLHEGLVTLFRDHPALAPELLVQALRADVPHYTEVRIDSADLTDIRPTEYRADAVVQLRRGDSVFGIVIEVQLSRDEDKGFVWPVYIATLRSRIRCPVGLLVIAPDAKVANWARQPIALGGDSRIVPWVLHAANIPEIVSVEEGKAYPELAVLSALAHGNDSDPDRAAKIALVAQGAVGKLDSDRGEMYLDLIQGCLSEDAREMLKMSDESLDRLRRALARHHRAEAKKEGRVEALVEVALAQLSHRFGQIPEAIQARVSDASLRQLKALLKRILDATTLDEAVGKLK